MGKHYDLEYKEKIIKEHLEYGYGSKFLGNKYNISYHTIDNWILKNRKQGNQINDINKTRGRKKGKKEIIDYKERYEILKKYQAFLKAQRERK